MIQMQLLIAFARDQPTAATRTMFERRCSSTSAEEMGRFSSMVCCGGAAVALIAPGLPQGHLSASVSAARSDCCCCCACCCDCCWGCCCCCVMLCVLRDSSPSK